ncbi:ABC transporter permease subunit [Brevibacillus sp. SYP-B805]|uniref:ABC transporter permease n=1 Tax=Brevibacillus sp. SYP-B805 TaxID=1578199 RepID=UPI0013EC0D0C|nr:ABC transporter permease subunit [Brevibacillus sp. SYP-B805]NGQ96319.1 ABC transporter permease subunit [Brevibacillus sp. SYP-B805]
MKAFLANPLIVKEMRERFRKKITYWILGLYLFVMGAILLGFMYVNQLNSIMIPGENRELFILIAVIQYAMICFIAPALSAGTISGERERQTLHVLLTTQLSPGRIIWSKLLTSLAYIFLMVISSLPLYSFVFLYGGISPQQLFTLVLFFAVNIVFFGALGLFCSTWIKRTGVSTITAYGLAFFFVVGTGLVCLFTADLLQELYPQQYPPGDVYQEPALQMLAALNPVNVMFQLLGEELVPAGESFLPPWLIFTLCYLGFTGILVGWSTYLLHPVRRLPWHWTK